jgi:hypothetical protein
MTLYGSSFRNGRFGLGIFTVAGLAYWLLN